VHPELVFREEGGRDVPLLVWRLPGAIPAISSGPLGGGIGLRSWVINATVPMSYDRDDPDVHLGEMAAALDLHGSGVGLMTGVDVAGVVTVDEDGVRVWATVGLSNAVQAARLEEDDDAEKDNDAGKVGTINVVAYVPARLSDAALVNAVATIAEAKAQALGELGLDATGTSTDATCVIVADGPTGFDELYGGPRSRWGRPLARAAYRSILAFDPNRRPWSDR
jgi:adenosylcobinamide amidohydrolase